MADATRQSGFRPRVTRRSEEHHEGQGRPKRSVPSMVRFTPDEFALVVGRARASGRPPARFIREAALGAIPRERRSAANAELLRQLGRIGNNLNQLAARAHIGTALPAELIETALGELLAAVRRIEPDVAGGA